MHPDRSPACARRPLLALCMACGALAASAAPSIAWTRPVDLMTEARAQFQLGLAPRVAVRADGTAVALWVSPVGAAPWSELRVSFRRPGGGWAAPLVLGRTKRLYHRHSLSVAGNTVAIAWPQRARSSEADRLRVWSRVGNAAPVTDGPATTGAVSDPGVVATDAGEFVTVWRERDTAWWGIRSPEGAWTRTRLDAGPRALDLSLAGGPDGSAIAVYRGPSGDAHPVFASIRAAGSGFPEPVVTAAGTTGNAPIPVLRADGRPAYLRATAAVSAVSWAPAGWAAPVTIATGAASGLTVAALPDGRLVAAWRGGDLVSSSRIEVAIERVAGGAWGAPVPLSAERPGLGDPAIAVGPSGGVLVAWTRAGTVVSRTRAPGLPVWSDARPISARGRSCRTPAITIGATGRAVAAFVCRGPGRRWTLAASEAPAP